MHSNSKISLAIAAAGIAAVMLVGCSSPATSGGAPKPEQTVAVDAPKEAAGAATFKDKTLTTKDVVIKITDVKTIQVGEKGNEYGDKPVIAFWYDTTNVSGGKDISPMTWIGLFAAYQDNDPNAENELNVAALPDDAFLDSQMNKIKKGGTVANAVAYSLSDTTTPVKLVASDDLGMSEIGSMTFELK